MHRALDPNSDRPIFQQIADHLRDDIRTARLRPGDQLPSEQQLKDEYGTARATIRNAIQALAHEGLIDVRHGRGSFVREHPPVRRLAHDRLSRGRRSRGKGAYITDIEQLGRQPRVEMLELGRSQASKDVAARLAIEPGADVLIRRRRYFADDEPMQLATTYVPWTLAQGTPMTEADTGPGGVYARIEEAGHRLSRFTEEIRARVPTHEEVRALRLPPGVPVITLVRVAHDTSGTPVEMTDTLMAADRYVLTYELSAD